MENKSLTEINPANLVPEDERAVEKRAIDINSASDVDVVLVKAVEDIVVEEERAVEENVKYGSNEFEIAGNLGILSLVNGMGNLKGVLDDRVYARIIETENGDRYIEFCEQYENGRLTPRFKIAQDDLIMAAMCGFQPQTISKESSLAYIKSDVIKFIKKLERECYRKYSGNQMHSIIEILTELFKALMKLPVEKENPEYEAGVFYHKVVHVITNQLNSVIEYKSYYALCDDDIKILAQNLKMKRLELLKRLKQYNLLYLTESSRGYQSNVRIKDFSGTSSYTEWKYCIYNLEYLNTLKEEQMGMEVHKKPEEEIDL